MSNTMKCLVKAKSETGLWMEDRPIPTPAADEVLIEVHRTGICGTDLHIWKWDKWAQRTIPVPMIVGHEFVGKVVEIGSYAAMRREDLKEGSIASAEGHIIKSRCRNVQAGKLHLARDQDGIGVNTTGAFAEYVCVPADNVWLHRDGIDLDVASIFDPLGNAVHTACQWNLLGEDVLITGAGPIGCMAAAVCKHAGARRIVVTDINPYRLELAKTLGATDIINVANSSLKDVMPQIGISEGFDIGLEMSGYGPAFQQMMDAMINGGNISLLGIFPDNINVNWDPVIFKMLTIKGIYGREMYETWYKMGVFVEQGLDISPIITHRYQAEDFAQGFETGLSGQSGKIVLNWK